MKTLIYSHLYELPNTPPERRAAFVAGLDMWYQHLRHSGRYTGDILLFTNRPDVRVPGLLIEPLPDVPPDPGRAFLHRVLHYGQVPIASYDVAMQMDLDILAVDNVNPLFPTDDRLWAAPSNLRLLDWRHLGEVLPRWRRGLHRFTGWRMRELGVSACVVASARSSWERNFGAWARAIREHGDRPLPRQFDQSFLNLLALRRTVPMARWAHDVIVHRDWDSAPNARLLHFPGKRKLQMEKYRKV